MQLFSDENKHTIHLFGMQIVISVKCTFISALRGPARPICSVLYGAACLICHNYCTHQGCQQRIGRGTAVRLREGKIVAPQAFAVEEGGHDRCKRNSGTRSRMLAAQIDSPSLYGHGRSEVVSSNVPEFCSSIAASVGSRQSFPPAGRF